MSDTSRPAWPIFVISLKDAHERRAKIRKALDDRGLEYEIMDAVDGRGGLPEEYEGILNRAGTHAAFTRDMSDTEYACALSHMSVYEQIVERHFPGAIVLEDDAILSPLFDEFLEARGYLQGKLIQLADWHGFVFRLENGNACQSASNLPERQKTLL